MFWPSAVSKLFAVLISVVVGIAAAVINIWLGIIVLVLMLRWFFKPAVAVTTTVVSTTETSDFESPNSLRLSSRFYKFGFFND